MRVLACAALDSSSEVLVIRVHIRAMIRVGVEMVGTGMFARIGGAVVVGVAVVLELSLAVVRPLSCWL